MVVGLDGAGELEVLVPPLTGLDELLIELVQSIQNLPTYRFLQDGSLQKDGLVHNIDVKVYGMGTLGLGFPPEVFHHWFQN